MRSHDVDLSDAGRRLADRIISELHKTSGDTPSIRAVRKRVSREIATVDRNVMLAVALELIGRAPFGRFVAYELLLNHAPTMDSITKEEVETLGVGINSWGDVDTFSLFIAGPAWHAGRLTSATITRWARSEDRWWRRAAAVSTVSLNPRKPAGLNGVDNALAICRLLASDRDDMVVKAVSWALRAVAKRDPERARTFISENRSQLAARVIREVENKLTTGLKNPRHAKATKRSR